MNILYLIYDKSKFFMQINPLYKEIIDVLTALGGSEKEAHTITLTLESKY